MNVSLISKIGKYSKYQLNYCQYKIEFPKLGNLIDSVIYDHSNINQNYFQISIQRNIKERLMNNSKGDQQEKQIIIDDLISSLEIQNEKRSEENRIQICRGLEHIQLANQDFQNYSGLQRRLMLEEISNEMRIEKFKAGSILFKCGEKGDKYYIVLKGTVEIYRPLDNEMIQDQELKKAIQNVTYDKLVAKGDQNEYQSQRGITSIVSSMVKYSNRRQQSLQRLVIKKKKDSLFNIPLADLLESVRNEKYNEERIFQDLHAKLATIGQGRGFGDLALMYNKPRFATARIGQESEAILVSLNKSSYNKISQSQMKQIKLKTQVLQQLFPNQPYSSLVRISYRFNCIIFPQNHVIYKEEEVAENFYVISEGEVRLEKTSKNDTRPIFSPLFKNAKKKRIQPLAILGKGSMFGLTDILQNNCRTSQAVCITNKNLFYYFNYKELCEVLQQEGNIAIQSTKEYNNFHSKQYSLPNYSQKITKTQAKINLRAMLDEEIQEKPQRLKEYTERINSPKSELIQQGLSEGTIKQMIQRNNKLQKKKKKLSCKITFRNPFFQDLKPENFRILKKIQLEFEKQRDREKFNEQFSVKNRFFSSEGNLKIDPSLLEDRNDVLNDSIQRPQTSHYYQFQVSSTTSTSNSVRQRGWKAKNMVKNKSMGFSRQSRIQSPL